MELSIREAAALLGRSPRTLRAQVARGEIVGARKGRGWVIQKEHLPLTDRQREALQARAQEIRNHVDEALPSRVGAFAGDRRRRLADLEAFRLGQAALATLPEGAAAALVHEALLDISEAWFVFDRGAKLAAIDRARGRIGRAVAHLLLGAAQPPDPATADRARALEDQVATALHEYARYVSRLPGRRR